VYQPTSSGNEQRGRTEQVGRKCDLRAREGIIFARIQLGLFSITNWRAIPLPGRHLHRLAVRLFVRSLHCLLFPPPAAAQQPTALPLSSFPTPLSLPARPFSSSLSPISTSGFLLHLFPFSPFHTLIFTFPLSTRLLVLVNLQQVARLADPLSISLDSSSTPLGLSSD
jgi:hypothetical protein